MANNQHSLVRSLLVPLSSGQLLLPSAVVAEIINYNEPEKIPEVKENWLNGILFWRNQRVPLLSLDTILSLSGNENLVDTSKRRTVILYGLEASQLLPFYAFMATGVPRALIANEENLTQPTEERRTGINFSVQIVLEDNKEMAWIPDLTYLENLLRKTPQVLAKTN